MISSRKEKLSRLFGPLVKLLQKTHLSPNAVTTIGFLISLLVIPVMITMNFPLTGIVILATGLFDALDGAYARMIKKVTTRGGFLDSVLDRYSDAVIIITMVYLHLCSTVWGIAALVGSLLVSYSRARVEAFGVKKFAVGLAERPVRLLMIATSFLLENWFPRIVNYTVIILAILTHLTVLQRAISAHEILKE